ncbi:MAG TPA: FAD-dependent oxidoreductase [Steroidobacteraceae bacterium]|nr:FAD-dependent oxidoreductase [Steroidobacteraceae bacterium]
MIERVVIVGAGQAAAQATDTLRKRGYAGGITLIGDEPEWPYQRPPLSKKYLAGALERERLAIRPGHFYAEHGVEGRLARRAVEIERSAQRVRLDDGERLAYDALILATGSRPRRIPAPGADLAGVHDLRTVADVERMRPALRAGARMVIVGGGYIGLEVAATARAAGLDVTVLEMAGRVMNRVICAPISSFYEAEHARHGVRIVCDARVRAFADDGAGRVRAVLTDDGREYPADLVLVGVGVAPADELAAAAGLECANGIVVDEHCRTGDPHILAAGDCTSFPCLRYGRRVRLESVDNAFEQGASAAVNLLGTPAPHDKVPWFWSDQFDLKLIIVGLCQEHDTTVVRGTPAARSFSVCYLRQGELIAIDTVNNAKDQMAARKLIAARARPNLDKLADPSVPLRDCL